MAAAQKAAGFSLGRADLLRRAMGKKKKEELDKQYEDFEGGMKANGFSAGAVKALWDTLLPFADYAFNRAHSAAYGVVSYWTAYMKANYAPEYMAALLTSVGDSKDKLGIYLSECRRMNIRVLPPDVNESIAASTLWTASSRLAKKRALSRHSMTSCARFQLRSAASESSKA
jgi:DNA polymerase-3 subunit alpha